MNPAFPLDQPHPLRGVLWGKEYPGEVVRASSWHARLGEMEALTTQLAQSLKEAFRRAKKEHPGKRIRLTWEE